MDGSAQQVTLAPKPGERHGPKLHGHLGRQVSLPPEQPGAEQRCGVLLTPTRELDEEQFYPGPTGDQRFPFLVYANDRLGLLLDQAALVDCQPLADGAQRQWSKKLRQQLLNSNGQEISPEDDSDYWIFDHQGQLALARVEERSSPWIYLDFYLSLGPSRVLNKRICWARVASDD